MNVESKVCVCNNNEKLDTARVVVDYSMSIFSNVLKIMMEDLKDMGGEITMRQETETYTETETETDDSIGDDEEMKESKYKNGKIYRVYSPSNPDVVYIGSTHHPLEKRMYYHKYNHRRYKQGKSKYCGSYEVLKYDDAVIELIKFYPCNSLSELREEEQLFINLVKEHKSCCNKIRAKRTKEQQREYNRVYGAVWRDENKNYFKNYYKNNKHKYKK